MKITTTTASEISSPGNRLDASYHASDGVKALQFLKNWAGVHLVDHHSEKGMLREKASSYGNKRVDLLGDVCKPNGIFIPGRFKRYYVSDQKHGEQWLSPTDMLKADLNALSLVSKKYTPAIESLRVHKDWILLSRSGTIGNSIQVREDMDGLIGSDDIIRIVADTTKIQPGYLYAYINGVIGRALIEQKTYGGVVQHIETHHIWDLLIPRLGNQTENQIHQLMQQASEARTEANKVLDSSKERFLRQVLDIETSEVSWNCTNEHAFATGTAVLSLNHYRLDGFHYVGYVAEAEPYLKDTMPLGELISPYQPPVFKRPYTDETGIPFLSGMDLYNAYPKPRLFISRKMSNLDRYIVEAGTILVQNVGQRYGLFGRPTILQKHLDGVSITQHLMRVYPNDPMDRGFVYIWLSTEVGRRLLLKQSFGTSMGVLFEHSFREMPVPKCSAELRHSFEQEVQTICDYRERANELEDEAQAILLDALGWDDF